MNNPVLLNVLTRDAKHVLSFATLTNCRDPSDPLRSLIILPVPRPIACVAGGMRERASGGRAAIFHQSSHGFANSVHGFATKTKALARARNPASYAGYSANVIYCINCSLCKKLYIGETGRRLGDWFREHLRDVEKDDKNTSKPVARHLILTVSTNAFHSTNLFCCFSRCQAPTNSVAPYFCIKTTHNPQFLDSLRRRASARNVSFRISLRWPIHIINLVDKTKLSSNTPTGAAPQFLRNSPPLPGRN